MEKKKLFSFIVEELNRHSPGYDCWTSCWGVDQPLPLSSLPTTRHVISRSPALGTLLYTPHSPSGITFFFFFFW